MSSAVSGHDERLDEPGREYHEELEAWVREQWAFLTPNDAMDVSEIEPLGDDCWIGEPIFEIADGTEPIVLSICGRDRRLHVR
jgi:hypothetical protein